MIPKYMFTVPTNPRISRFFYLIACWTSLLEYIMDTSNLACSKMFSILATLAPTSPALSFSVLPLSLRDITSHGVVQAQSLGVFFGLFFLHQSTPVH